MLNKIDKVLTHVENAITGSLFIASLLVLGWNIIMRKVFHNASTWAEEAIRYAIIWVTFVGSSQCAKSGKHVGIDILVEALPKGMRTAEFREFAGCRKYVYAFSSLLACGFCVFCAWYGWSLTDMVITNNRVSAAMEMPMWILYISIPIGFGLTAIRFLIDAIRKLRQDEKPAIDKTDDGKIDISMM